MGFITPNLKNNLEHFEFTTQADVDANIANKVDLHLTSKNLQTTIKHEIISYDDPNIKIKTHVAIKDYSTQEIFQELENTSTINKNTRKYVDTDTYFLLPLNTQKQNYSFWSFGDRPLELNFMRIDKFNDLDVYVFESIDSYNTTGSIKQFSSNIIFSDMFVELFIEPITGQLIWYDAYVTNKIILDDKETVISKNHGTTSDYSSNTISEWVRQQIDLFFIYDFIVPVFLFVIFGTVFLINIYRLKSKENEKIIINQHMEIHKKDEEKMFFLEEKFKQEKFITIGKLSSRLAHDIRNPLSVIALNVELLRSALKIDSSKQKQFDRIEKSIYRITHQMDDVLGFVKGQPMKLSNVNISEIILESLETIKIPPNIQLIISDDDLELFCDKNQISIVLNNLILNSIQTLDGYGSIEIMFEDENNDVVIYVKDSGDAIPENILSKMFDPLFTTKQEGTGLGLVSVKSIIESHKGTISVTSPPTTFKIKLPKNKN
jgi:signal transduction histidine kinase